MRISDWSSDVCSSDLRRFVCLHHRSRYGGDLRPCKLECFRAHTNHRSHNHDLQQGCERLEVRVVYGSIDALLHATNSAWQRCDQPCIQMPTETSTTAAKSEPNRSEEHTSETSH